MIYRHGFHGPDRWVTRTQLIDGREPPWSDGMIPLSAEEFEVVNAVPTIRHGEEGLEVPADDRVAWKVLRHRGYTGVDAHRALEQVRAVRQRIPRDVTTTVQDPAPVMRPRAPLGALFPDVPGLRIEAMSAAHLDAATVIAVAAEIHAGTCPPACGVCVPPEAHGWLQMARRLDHAEQWPLVWTFQGQPLQYELIGFTQADTKAILTMTFHANRERPSWFYREAERPVFAALNTVGVRHLESYTRSDRPDWIQSLKDNYGAEDTGVVGSSDFGAYMLNRLEFPLDLGRFTGWPARRQVGFDWTRGRVRVREATAADHDAAKAFVQQEWTARGRGDLVGTTGRQFGEWWYLDRASLLLGLVDGAIREVTMVRPRRGAVAGLLQLSPLEDDAAQGPLSYGTALWMQQAGYATATKFPRDENLNHPKFRNIIFARQGWLQGKRHESTYGQPVTELSLDLATMTAKDPEAI